MNEYEMNMKEYGTDTPLLIKIIKAIRQKGLKAYCIKERMTTANIQYGNDKYTYKLEMHKEDYLKSSPTKVAERAIKDFETYVKFQKMLTER